MSQAACRNGNGTTEHVFAMKILCKIGITSCDSPTHSLLLDMTKALDAINRKHLYKHLSELLHPCELSTINILMKVVRLQVRNNKAKGQFSATFGIPQGDSRSAILFTLYLLTALSTKNTNSST